MSENSHNLRHRKPDKTHEQELQTESDTHSEKQTKSSYRPISDKWIAFALAAIALPIRFYLLSNPDEVVFDEVHFGGYASHYIKREFFFDVHPPLAKMIIALVGFVAGYNGKFDFGKIGNRYTNRVPFTQIRFLGSFLSVLSVPTMFLTLRYGGHSVLASVVAALALCFENSMVTNHRLILLDSYLLFFIAFTLMAWNKFQSLRAKSFQYAWWKWLSLTGLGLGLALSCKWVGLFTVATIGLSTVNDLWRILGDLSVSKKQIGLHFFARVLCLICLPVAVYVYSFYLHFSILANSGPGDPFMPSDFQHTLIGNNVPSTYEDIMYDSVISIRHVGTNGGYLHSHNAAYPEGSQQQQITLYPYEDENNLWVVRRTDSTEEIQDVLGSDNKTWLQYVRHGETIQLEHLLTSPRKLHSHDVKAPLTDTEHHKEVSCYGFKDYPGDMNDNWILDIVNDVELNEPTTQLRALRSNFLLIHVGQVCSLYSKNLKLPQWGFGQQEVSCLQNGYTSNSHWMIESARHDLLPEDSPKVNYIPIGFWKKFKVLHREMLSGHYSMTDSHPFESRPSEWPVLLSGIMFWTRQKEAIVLLGNPLVYWASTITVFTFIILWSIFRLREKRGYKDEFKGRRGFFEAAGGFYVLGWLLHYLPFYVMDRQLFLHHYMPALYLATLAFGVGLDLVFTRFSTRGKLLVSFMITLAFFAVFISFAPTTYGTEWSYDKCKAMSWLPTWNFDCDRYAVAGASD